MGSNTREIGKVLGVFIAQVDHAIENGHPSSGAHPTGINRSGITWKQRYANGNADSGRLSVTVIEQFRGEDLVLRYFRMGNSKVFKGEDTPESGELDITFDYRLSIRESNLIEAVYAESDNAGFKRHLEEYSELPDDDEEARAEHIEAFDDFDFERPVEPGEIERIGYLLTRICRIDREPQRLLTGIYLVKIV